MLEYLLNCFTFKGLFENRNSKARYNIFWFILLIFITSFPLNFQIFSNNGWEELNTVTLQYRQKTPNWVNKLPNDVVITNNGLIASNTTVYVDNYDSKTYMLVINPSDEVVDGMVYSTKGYTNTQTNEFTPYTRCIVLAEKECYYYQESGKSIVGNYAKVTTPQQASMINQLDEVEASSIIFNLIDNCFNSFMIFSNIAVNTLTQAALNLILVLLISAIAVLIRIKYEKVVTYTQSLRIFISSMTIPGLISFVVGITGIADLTSFTVVLFQLITPLLALGAIYKGSKIKDPSIKYVA